MMQNVVYKIFIKFVFRVTKSPIKPHFRGGGGQPPPLKFFQGGAFSTLGGGGACHIFVSLVQQMAYLTNAWTFVYMIISVLTILFSENGVIT